MEKKLVVILSIGILVIITISGILTLTGVVYGLWGDRIIMIASVVVAAVMFFAARKTRSEKDDKQAGH